MTAAERWAEALAAWGIPDEILAQAPESPWGFPSQLFAGRNASGPTQRQARESLPSGGALLDVGSGAGGASLGITPPAGRLTGVDPSVSMLAAVRERCPPGIDLETIEGRWPDVAATVGVADVVVSAHVVYNVGDLDGFVAALTEHARHRVVVELTEVHPASTLAPLWSHFWGIERPASPTADDAVAVVAEVIGAPPALERWERLGPDERDPAEIVAWVRRRLCLPMSADPEVASLLGPHPRLSPPGVVTVWWDGTAT